MHDDSAHRTPALGSGLHAHMTSLGLALIIAGQPIAWWVRGTFFRSESAIFPAIPVLLGLILMVRLRPLQRPAVHAPLSLVLLYSLGFLLPVSFLSLVDVKELITDSAYSFYLALLMIAMMLIPYREFSQLSLYVLLVGGLSSTLPLVQLATSPPAEAFVRLTVAGNQNPIVTGAVGAATVIASLIYLHTNRRGAGFAMMIAWAFICGVTCVILSNTRSIMLSLIIAIVLFYTYFLPVHLNQNRPFNRYRKFQIIFLWWALGGAAIAAPTAAVAILGPEILGTAVDAAVSRFEGVYGILAGSGGQSVDRSSAERIEIITRTFNDLTFWGKGISIQLRSYGNIVGVGIYPHFSYLQIFYDLGFFIAIWFFILQFVIPAAIVITRCRLRNLDATGVFAVSYYIHSHMDHFMHGTPYGWTNLLPVILVYVIVARTPVQTQEVHRAAVAA